VKNCLFCAIASGGAPSHRVCETDEVVAFLDIHPVRPGHTLVIPRAHHAYFDDLPAQVAAEMLALGQRLARGMKVRYGAPRVGFAFTGIDVPHAHAHVIPMMDATDLTSRRYIAEENLTFRLTPRMDDGELASMAAVMRAELAG